MNTPSDYIGTEIAVVGMAGRFPGAQDVDAFWENLRDGVESVTFYAEEELLEAGADPERVRDPNFIPASLELEAMDAFDASFFGFSPRDAEIMDPQHRIFLECAWHGLEHAGYDPKAYRGAIGVYAGIGPNDYYIYNLLRNQQLMDSVGEWLVRHTSNDKDFFATRISYELDLRGPSVNIQTACSTSLVSVHLASQALISGECDIALAGGVTLLTRDQKGYIYRPGEILSPDGHCRAFDADSQGTIFGSGAGLVVLKRYDEAVADGDTIHAVIRGSAVNNDGAQKVGYMAPSVDGQTAAVTEAISMAGIDPETISYVEAHGTGTSVGDPIEVRALTQAFRTGTDKNQFCGIGSVKSNIGHLDHAAGISSLIKTILALEHKQLPPSLNYERPNPKMEIDTTPFYVNDALRDWTPPEGAPRRAGVNSLGIGGTNAHLILEEAPASETSPSSRPVHVLPIAARTASALETATDALAAHLRAHPEAELADVAHTLQVGRRGFEHRRAVVGRDREDAIQALSERPKGRVAEGQTRDPGRGVAFLFPGQGAQHANMGRGLYDEEPVFREHLDRCAERLQPLLDVDLRDLLFPAPGAEDAANDKLGETAYTQPALFAIQYATAQQWMHWGIEPTAMIGHSIGEYAAACLAGVMSLEDALTLVVERGRLMQAMEPGTMLSVGASEEAVEPYLDGPVTVSVINAPTMCVVGGPDAAVRDLQERLEADDIPCRPLRTSHAFHSGMMEPALAPFQEAVEAARLHPPEIPFVSNRSGTWITDEEATDPAYWTQHIRRAVRFSDGIATLLEETEAALLEVGPGNTLRSLTRQHPACDADRAVVNSLRHPKEDASDTEHLARALGRLWAAGVDVSWERLYAGERRRRIPLPRYPFERTAYWIDADPASTPSAPDASTQALTKRADMDQWFYEPSWTRSSPPARPAALPSGGTWLVFEDEGGLTDELLQRVEAAYAEPEGAGDTPRRLELGTPGDVDSLALQPADRQAPGPGEIEIRVHAAALQFKDVLMALGLYADDPVPMGAECAGTIVRVGEGVSDFEVGDDVLAAGFDSFQSFVTRDVRMVASKPDALRFEEAVTIPSGFLTAYHALIREAGLQPGERVLIHAASGGVGQSAVQIAQMVGAEVFGTAGSPRKRDFLREELGVEHVYDSRSLDFADGIMADTGGEGIDVVLNSLTDEAIVKGLEIMRPHGRFLELGKKDLYEEGNLPDVPNRDTIAYTIIDMDAEREERTGAFQSLFRTVMGHIEAGRLEPLPRSVFPWDEAPDAFQYMSQTKHIGKVVLALRALPPTTVRVRPGAAFEQVGPQRFTIRPDHPADYAALLEAVGVDDLRHVVHAWNVTPDEDARSEAAFWREEQDRAFYSLFHLGKALAAGDPEEPLPIHVLSTAMQRVSGEQALRPSKATLLGPCRVIPHEFPALRCRSIDVAWPPASTRRREPLADDLAREVLAPGSDRSVAYRGMDRWVQGVEPAAVEEAPAAAPQVREGGVYLITGGLGGIGLQMAEHLARSTPVKLVLTSRSGLPPRDEWKARLSERGESDPVRRTIQAVLALEALGAEVLVGAADVTDRDAMGALMEEVRARFGRVDGVIHAAGVVDDDLLPLKDAEAAARVLAPKVEGTLVLDAALEDAFGGEPLDFFVLFSSVSALVGLPGQIDYTAANAFLDAFAQRKQAIDGVPALSINWSAWQEVGMAAEIAAGDEPGADDGEPVAHPLLDRRRAGADGAVFESTLAPRNHWILDGHRNTHGEAILPGTGYLELARAAFAEATGQAGVALGEVYFVSPLEIRSGTQRRLRVRLEPGEEGVAFTVESQPAGGEAGGEAGAARWDEHANGTARPLDAAPDERRDVAAVADRCTRAVRTFGPDDRTRQEKHLRFGPRWRCLREVRYGEGEALARLELPEIFAGDLQHYKLHPALLDMATGFGLPLVDGYEARDDFYVPLSYEAFRLYRPLPRQLYSHMRCRNASEQEMPAFDVTLMDAEGRVVAEVTAFTMKRVPAGALAGPSPRQQGAPATGSSDGLAFDVSTGLLPAEGTEAFDRILASRPRPQIIVSTVDLPAWQARIDETTAPAGEDEDAEGDAPAATGDEGASEADASFIAPRDDVERTIADIWNGMLGLDRVGLHDDFFDVGGHSLIAVRMFAKVRKAYGLDLPLAVLMEAPTLGGFADVVRSELGLEPPAEEVPEEEGSADAEDGAAEDAVAKDAATADTAAKDPATKDPAEAQGAEEERTAERAERNVSEKPKASDEFEPSTAGEPEPSTASELEPSAPSEAARAQSGDGAVSPGDGAVSSPGEAHPGAAPRQAESGPSPDVAPDSAARERPWNPLVPIREEGAQPPFFCVHGAGGNVLNFRDLAKYLGGDQPFYGLQARGVEGKRAPHERIEDMAAEYVEAIRAVQPEGPYRIGGYSAGGVVAFEMAHRLRAQGETVALLALLDTFCPTLHGRPSKSFFEKVRDHVRGIAEHGWDYGRRYTRDRFDFEQNRLRRMQVALYEKLGKRLPIELRDIPMVDAYFEAVSGYALTFYPGKIALFTARDKGHVYDHVPHHMGWEELAGELEVHKVPGTHDNLMQEPNVEVLVDRLKEELEQSATQDLVS